MKTYVFSESSGEIKRIIKTSDLSQYSYEGSFLELPADTFVDAGIHRIEDGKVVEKEKIPFIEPLTIQEDNKFNRQAAYTQEADPLFFKWQAGEATKEEWEAKRKEIRQRFPYPEGTDNE